MIKSELSSVWGEGWGEIGEFVTSVACGAFFLCMGPSRCIKHGNVRNVRVTAFEKCELFTVPLRVEGLDSAGMNRLIT